MTVSALRSIPRPVPVGKWGWNFTLPHADQIRHIADALAHVIGSRRKALGATFQSSAASDDGIVHRFRFRTGIAAREVIYSLALHGYLGVPSTIPRFELRMRKAGGSFDTVGVVYKMRPVHTLNMDGISWVSQRIEVEEDTTYEFYVERFGGMLAVSSSLYEAPRRASAFFPPRISAESPIYAQDVESIVDKCNDIILSSLAHYISWTHYSIDGQPSASGDEVNLRDASDMMIDGGAWRVDMSRVGRRTCTFSANARTEGSPSPGQQNAVQLREGGSVLAEVGPFWDESAWLATTVEITGDDHALEVWLKEGSGDTLLCNAVSLYPVEEEVGSQNSADFVEDDERWLERADADLTGIDFTDFFSILFWSNPGQDWLRAVVTKGALGGGSDTTFAISFRSTSFTNDGFVVDLRLDSGSDVQVYWPWSVIGGEGEVRRFAFVFSYFEAFEDQKLYIDGQDQGAPSVSGASPGDLPGQLNASSSRLKVGQSAKMDPDEAYQWPIDDLQIWDGTLSSSEVSDLSPRRLTESERNETSLGGYWTFDGDFDDHGPHANHLHNPTAADRPYFRGPLFGPHRVP